jgi:hypothetical protein
MKPLPVLFTAVLAVWCAGCKPTHNTTITGGGKGGHAVIRITPEAYNIFVDTCTIYIKYGTLDAPADGVYDDSAKCDTTGGKPVATFSGLTVGLYYFYGQGYHSGFSHPPHVKGGAQQTVAKEDSFNVYLPTYSYNP